MHRADPIYAAADVIGMMVDGGEVSPEAETDAEPSCVVQGFTRRIDTPMIRLQRGPRRVGETAPTGLTGLMEKDERQTLNELLKTTSVRRRYGAHERVISYDEAVEQLERELLKVLRGAGVSKTGREV